MSIPTPEGEALLTRDTDKLLLTSNEYNRLQGLLSRAEKQAEKSPFKVNPTDLLRAEYERGFDEGGPGGGAIVRAIVQLARDYGLDIDAIVDSRRKHYHHESLVEADKRRMRANMVGRSVPEPPFPHPDGIRQTSGRTGTYGRGQNKTFMPSTQKGGMLFQPRKRSHWR